MEHTAEEWEALQNQVKMLRQENQVLKRALYEGKEAGGEDEEMLIRSTVQFGMKKSISKQIPHMCTFCHPKQKSKEQLRTELQSWSQKLSANLYKKKQPVLKMTHSGQSNDSPIKQAQSEEKNEEGLLEKICLFGPNQQKAVNIQSKTMLLPHQLYFPKNDPQHTHFESYGYSLYPESVDVKVVRQKNKGIQIGKIIFRKSLKPIDYKLVIFQNKQEFVPPKNLIKKEWNPFSTIYCVSVDFPDYLFSERPYQGVVNRAISMIDDRSQNSTIMDSSQTTQKSPQKLQIPNMLRSNSSVSVYGDTSIYKSNFNLSVMSYYPLIDFFCQFLKELINYVKIKRIHVIHDKPEDLKETVDIKAVVEEMQKANPIFRPLFLAKTQIGSSIQFSLGDTKFNLQLDKNMIRQELSRDWAYRMLRMLDKDTLYDIYCLVMQEESVVFFCQNSYILTFMIYLFVGLLIHPFSYPHTIISSVFDLDHLETPFIAIMGLSKPNSWLHQNQEELLIKMENKVLVHITEDEVRIKCKKRNKLPKSQKLKKVFGNFYKRSQKLEGTTKHKDILSREITKAQNDLTIQLISQIENYFKEELLRFAPNIEIIDLIKKQLMTQNDNLATISAKLIKKVQQYITECKKNNQRDLFVDMLIDKQIFSVYLTIRYDIA